MLLTICSFVMYYIIPKFKVIFEGFETKLPALTESVISISNAGVNFWYLIVLAIPVALVGLWLGTGFCLDMFGLGPGWGRRPFALSLRILPRLKTPPLLRCLAVCIEGGRPIVQALGSLSEYHPDISFRGPLSQIFDEVSRGDECWLALRACGMLRRGEMGLLEAAQRVGNLPWALRSIADGIERRALYRFHLAMQFVDPSLTLAVGCVIGIFCVSMFLPLIELLQKLS
jgi:type II secretory pathway component PulF